MKTISTKLDNKLHSQFIEVCNNDGKCQSEMLRDLIETLCEDCSDDDGQLDPQDLEYTLTSVEPKPTITIIDV